MGKGRGGVRAATDGSIEIDFYYRGARCRERLKLPPTPRNLNAARNKLGQIKAEIAANTFDYASHFPGSSRAAKLTPFAGGLVLVRKALNDWYDRMEPELQHSTLLGYRRIIDHVLAPAIGDIPLRDLTRVHVKDRLIGGFDPDVTAKRINNVLGPLRSMLTEAVDDGLIQANPIDTLVVRRRGRVDATEDVDPFTPDEVKAILATAEGQFRNFCAFNFATGLRTSEMIGLHWPRIDWINGRARISQAFVMGAMKTTKTQAGIRDVQLLPQALAALAAQKAHTYLAGAEVFQDPDTLAAWGGDKQVRVKHWTRVLKKAGVRYRYPYQMRHTFASTALSAGENVMWVARQMGHKDWTVTARRYARWIPSVVPDAGAKLSELWSTSGQQSGESLAR